MHNSGFVDNYFTILSARVKSRTHNPKSLYFVAQIIIMTLFRCQVIHLAGQKPTNWGHHLYHLYVDGDLSHDRQIHTQAQKSPRAYGLTSFSEKTRKSNHLQLLEQRQHLLNYFKTLSVGPAGNRTEPPARQTGT